MTKKGATGDFFFSFLPPIFFSPKLGSIFLPPKTKMDKKKDAAALLTIILATRWTGNRLFLWAALP